MNLRNGKTGLNGTESPFSSLHCKMQCTTFWQRVPGCMSLVGSCTARSQINRGRSKKRQQLQQMRSSFWGRRTKSKIAIECWREEAPGPEKDKVKCNQWPHQSCEQPLE